MNVGEWLDVILRTLFALGVPGAGVWYLRERRKSRAADEVAERTVPAEVRIKDADALNAHIAAVERAFEVERESKDRRIAAQDHQLADQEQQIAHLTVEVQELRLGRRDDAERIAALRDEVRALKEQVQALMSARLTEQPTEETP